MGDKSKIEWTDATWPIVQGCDPVSQGCVHCYAVQLLWRLMHNPDPKVSGPLQGLVEKHVNAAGEEILRFTGKLALREDRLTWPLQWKKPRMIFVPSHGDIFHKDVPRAFIAKIFAKMRQAHWHTYQVLTKRGARACELLNDGDFIVEVLAELSEEERGTGLPWPLPNVWLGVSCEDQDNADERIPHLLQTPAAIRFVSAEPLLAPIDFRKTWARETRGDIRLIDGLDWIIAGGESGKGARPMHPQWARDIRDHCEAAGVAFFFKQWGAWLPSRQGAVWRPYPDNTVAAHALAVNGAISSGDKLEGGPDKRPLWCTVQKVGKKRAGRLLDGFEHNEFPKVAA